MAHVSDLARRSDARGREIYSEAEIVESQVLKVMLQTWSVHTGFNWKWEYMQRFIDALLPIWDLLATNFKLEKIKGWK